MPSLFVEELCNCPQCRFRRRDLGNVEDPSRPHLYIPLEGRFPSEFVEPLWSEYLNPTELISVRLPNGQILALFY